MLNALRPLLLLAAVAAAAAPVHAEEARQRRLEAAERIREVERDGGRVLQAERMQRGGREVYRYKVLEGKVPATGGPTSLFIDWIGPGGGVGPGFHGVGVGRRGARRCGGCPSPPEAAAIGAESRA